MSFTRCFRPLMVLCVLGLSPAADNLTPLAELSGRDGLILQNNEGHYPTC